MIKKSSLINFYKMKQEDILKYIEGSASQSEKDAIMSWLEDSPENMKQFIALRELFDASIWYNDQSFDRDTNIISNTTPVRGKSNKLRITTNLIKYAAVFVLALLSYHFYQKRIQHEDLFLLKKVVAPKGQRTELDLSDGSKVWLNANSSITFPENQSDTSRVVILDGEAYFEVAHSPRNRFIVQTPKYDVKVHGTEFNVVAYNDRDYFETSLIKGSVEVSTKNSERKMMLTPNQKFLSDEHGERIETIDSLDQYLWKDGILAFNDKNVSEIFSKIENCYDITFDVKNKDVLTNTYTGKFRIKDGVEHILKVLQLGNNFKFEITTKNNKKHIIIT